VRPAFPTKEGGYSGLAIPAHAATPILVARWQSMVHPADVVRVDAGTGENRFLTEFNKERMAQIDWQPPREFWFTSKTGRRIQSLLVLPPAFDASRKYPLLVFPHGGPHDMIKDMFFFRWNYHLLTSPGYVLLMTNYTGSTGYGEEFAEAIHKDILRGPAAEIEQAADEAIHVFPFIDATRQAAAGASYGGYLMNWFEGNTKRFKCLVSHAGLADNTSFWGATDDSYYWETRNGGPVWEQKGAWRDQNPSTYAANFSTPMLVTQGARNVQTPAAPRRSEPPGDLPRSEPLGHERRRRTPAYARSAGLAGEVSVAPPADRRRSKQTWADSRMAAPSWNSQRQLAYQSIRNSRPPDWYHFGRLTKMSCSSACKSSCTQVLTDRNGT
jgi:dipeptidyl aminopeptidase/acylaminoacyl peptidase